MSCTFEPGTRGIIAGLCSEILAPLNHPYKETHTNMPALDLTPAHAKLRRALIKTHKTNVFVAPALSATMPMMTRPKKVAAFKTEDM